jgi:hypothetical protein
MMECMIRSLNKHTECTIHVFDNSDEYPFDNTFPNVDVIDNTKGQIINFDTWMMQYPERQSSPRSNFGSIKHTISVEMCFDILPKGFILMDSDVLAKKDISSFWNESYGWVGEPFFENHLKRVWVMRLLPFLCYINVPMVKEYGIRYFNDQWMWHLWDKEPNKFYDTGAWFLKACMDNGVPARTECIKPYIEHYYHGSHEFRNESLPDWLNEHRDLWK